MPDLATVSVFLGSIKTATDIARAIKGADASLERAELKLKIAELMESLANVKIQAVEIQELIQEKDTEIKKLKLLLETKNSSPVQDLPEQCINIIKLLGENSHSLPTQQISYYLEMPDQRVKYFLDILTQQGLLESAFSMRSGMLYSLNDKSRKLLYEKGLL